MDHPWAWFRHPWLHILPERRGKNWLQGVREGDKRDNADAGVSLFSVPFLAGVSAAG